MANLDFKKDLKLGNDGEDVVIQFLQSKGCVYDSSNNDNQYDIKMVKNNKITKIHKNCKPCRTDDCERYTGKGDMVLEINGGDCDKYDIVVGDKLIFQD